MRSQQSGVHISRPALVLATAILLAGVRTASAATTETFVPTTIQYPGSTSTVARGINNSGEVAGTYSCAAACVNPITGETSTAGTHGFLLQDGDRKSTRLNSSHRTISYAVFCLKKKIIYALSIRSANEY